MNYLNPTLNWCQSIIHQDKIFAGYPSSPPPPLNGLHYDPVRTHPRYTKFFIIYNLIMSDATKIPHLVDNTHSCHDGTR